MTRTVQPPAVSTRTIDQFLGQKSDRRGPEIDEAEFTAITNYRNNGLESLSKRLGAVKSFAQTHTNGAKVYGLHTYVNDAGTEVYYKLSNRILYESSGGAWSAVGSVTDFANANTYFATINTKDTGAANSTSGTSTSSTSTTLDDTGAGWTINAFDGEVLTVNNEIKLINANDTDTLFLNERFDENPDADAFTVNPRAQEFFFANGTEFYKSDGTVLTQLNTSTFAYAFEGIEAHQNRLWGWKGTRLYYSDTGVGEHFSRGSNIDFQTPIIRVKSLGEVLVIYERNKVSALFGDNPDNFFLQHELSIGTNSPNSVANYYDLYQFFLSTDGRVIILTIKKLSEIEEPVSVSTHYIDDDIATQSAANIATACAEVDGDNYHLCIDDDWYILNVEASAEMKFQKWIWTKDDRPAALDANVLGHFGTQLVAGAQDNGQVYDLDKAGTFADDGTAIATLLEKQRWNPGNASSRKKFDSLRVIQDVTASTVTMNFFADPDGVTYGSAITTVDLNTAGTDEHEYKFTGNPTDIKNSGRKISYKFTESSSVLVSDIEQIELHYTPGIIT